MVAGLKCSLRQIGRIGVAIRAIPEIRFQKRQTLSSGVMKYHFLEMALAFSASMEPIAPEHEDGMACTRLSHIHGMHWSKLLHEHESDKKCETVH
eukprot:scaffold279678_cov17-Prasinocladus_malaysianus.AAC.1